MGVECSFNNTVTERDMDLLFAESVVSHEDFLALLLDKTDLKGCVASIASVELSKADRDLGESDITVVVVVGEERIGLLVEDKIDAIAMPRQHERYVERGNLGIKNGEYDNYYIFLFCPQKYYDSNGEAKKYNHLITYEECRDFFAFKSDALSHFRIQQLEQAIKKAKRVTQQPVNEIANTFLRHYIEYQKEYYPSLDLSTSEDANGYWTDYRTDLGYVYIFHKIQEGYVDLIFPKTDDKVQQVKAIAEWMRHHIDSDTRIEKAKKSTMIRVRVPKIDINAGFEFVNKEELNRCFDIIREFTEFANIIELANSITVRK